MSQEREVSDQSSLVLYHMPGAASLRVKWLLSELNLPYEENIIKDYKELRTEAFLALQPLGQVPVLKDRDVLLWDSGAILEWTLETHASKKLAPPPATRERAIYLQFYHFAESTMLERIMDYLRHTVFFPPEKRSAFAAQVAKQDLRAQLQMLDRYFEKTDNQFIVGREFTAADIMLGYDLLLISRFIDELLPDEVFKAASYWARLMDRKGYIDATGDFPKMDSPPPVVDYTDALVSGEVKFPKGV